MKTKVYLISGNGDAVDELPVKQSNYIYNVDEEVSTKKEALKLVKELTEDFNERFNTNYKSDYLFDIELVYYDEYGDRVD